MKSYLSWKAQKYIHKLYSVRTEPVSGEGFLPMTLESSIFKLQSLSGDDSADDVSEWLRAKIKSILFTGLQAGKVNPTCSA